MGDQRPSGSITGNGSRKQQLFQLAGLAALIGLLLQVVTASVQFGRRDERIESLQQHKLDAVRYAQDQLAFSKEMGALKEDLQRQISTMSTDVSVVRALLCAKTPGACGERK